MSKSLSDMKSWGDVMSRQASCGDLSTREIDERTELLVRSSDPASLGEVIKVLLRKMADKCRNS